MNILVIGLDRNIVSENSASFKRATDYAKEFESYTVVIPCLEKKFNKFGNFEAHGSGGKTKICRFARVYKLAKKIIKEKKIDIISVQDIYYLGYLGVILGKKFNCGVEIQVHGIEKMSFWRQEIAEQVFKKAGSIRVVGRVLRKSIKDYFEIPDEKIVTVPIFLDWEGLKYQKFDYKIKDEWKNHFIFLTVSRLVPVKNVGGMIRAFVKVVKDFPESRLVIVGDGPLRVKLESLAQDIGVRDSIDFVGWQNNIVDYYRGADCYVGFSNNEGYGMTLIEALSYQLPVITTEVGIGIQIIKDGENGLFVRKNDIESLANMMKLVVINKELLKSLKDNTRKYLEVLPDKEEVINLYKKSWQKAYNHKNNKN